MRNRACIATTRGLVRRAAVILILCGSVLAVPSRSYAEGELTGVIGGMLGGDLNNIIQGNVSVSGAWDNGPLYGVRIGWIKPFFGLEGSFVGSPSGIGLDVGDLEVKGKVYYFEGSAMFIPIPGPISPFIAAGIGLHQYSFDDQGDNLQKMGFVWGGGLKVNIKALTFRFDIRDHMTKLEEGDFDLVPPTVDLRDEATLHNVELSAGVGFRF